MRQRSDPALAERLYERAVAAVSAVGGDEEDGLRRAVALLEEALEVAPRDQDMHGRVAIALAENVGRLYRHTEDDALLRRWVKRARRWFKIVPEDDWRMPLYVLAFGVLLYHRARTTDDAQDLGAAIETLETARRSVGRSSGIHGTASAHLSQLRLSNYRGTLDPAELEFALHDAWNVVQGERANPRERYLGLATLAHTLTLRSQLGGDDSDILAAVAYADRALEIAVTGDDRAAAHEVRATAYRHRFGLTGKLADLDEAIVSIQFVIERAGEDPEMQAGSLDSYGNLLFDRYGLTGEADDLTGSIEASRRALSMLSPDSPARVRALGNLGATLAEASQRGRDTTMLDEAIGVSRAGLADADRDPAEEPRLWAQLATSLTLRALGQDPNVDLLDGALDAFDRSEALLSQPGAVPVDYALGRQRRWWPLSDRYLAALLGRAQLASGPGDHPWRYLRRALEVGESAKSRLLTDSIARTSLRPPPEVPSELATTEHYLLSELDHIDAVELAAVGTTPTAERLRLLERRQAVRRHLDDIWADMAAVSEAAGDYVAMRRGGGARGLLDALDAGDPDTAYMAILASSELRSGLRRLVVLAARPGRQEPVFAATDPGADPIPDALQRFVPEVPTDAGRGLRDETWHGPLVALLQPVVAALGWVGSYVISPPVHGRGLPWHVVLERCGWPSEEGPGSVVTVPTLAIASGNAPRAGHAGAGDNPLIRVVRESDSQRAADRGVALIRALAGGSPPQSVVVGNPTGDLRDATEEARQVARALGVEPLLGADATVQKVRSALEVAPVVHLAAHARFESDSPLDSPILLADGTLRARALIETSNRADLVVLSACETAVGGSLAAAEVAGLTHALLRAGTRAVIASLWPVDDASTAFLMRTFYRVRSSGGSNASALAMAMRETRARPGWEQPYFWAGFIATERGGV